MVPVTIDNTDYQMLSGKNGAVVYAHKKQEIKISLPAGIYSVKYIHPQSGELIILSKKHKMSDIYTLKVDKVGAYWLQRIR